MDSPLLAFEAAVGRIALAWVAHSAFASDVLFAARPALLVVLEGFQADPLANALRLGLGSRALSLALDQPQPRSPSTSPPVSLPSDGLALHPAHDAEDEAQTAAACVLAALAHQNPAQGPVALVATDRLLTRRVRAMLSERGIAVRDETGWKLSTTRAAATLMGLLRASAWNASSDAVLDWLKNAPAFDSNAVTQTEIALRHAGLRDWRGAASHPAVLTGKNGQTDNSLLTRSLIQQADAIRASLLGSRSLAQWLADLRDALQNAGQWPGLVQDSAGQAVIKALHIMASPDNAGGASEYAGFNLRVGAAEFTAWVSQTLEAANFMPAHPPSAQVVILPLSQLLGRVLNAVVLPGCDEVRLPMCPEPPGDWSPAQRSLLGLPSREALAAAHHSAWQYALQSPRLDVLWLQSEGGEHLMPSGFVQALLLHSAPAMAADPRPLREVTARPCTMPHPRGDALPVTRLSSSAYEDLRRCPYRFFALRQLKLQESDELDIELGKRDFGNWLHMTLKNFHEALNLEKKEAEMPTRQAQAAMINIASELATETLGLSPSEFLPFAASWPRVRTGYLQWLAEHQARGITFTEAEAWKELPLGALTLVGKIDRIDWQKDDAGGGHTLVIDYKTEGRSATAERVKTDSQDTQLAFYAALLPDDTLAASYVNVGEKDATKDYAQNAVVEMRDQLIAGVRDDISRIAQGAALPAMGEGKTCDFCAARGLCRKDFWI
jgi:ATP-dependent helicase/nuclease subunit B